MEIAEARAEELTFIAVGLMIIVTNLVEIVYISRNKHKNTFEKLLLSLAISDLLVGITATVYKTSDFLLGKEPWLSEGVAAIVFMFSSIFSLKNLLVLTIDRFLAIRFPIKHRILVTARRTNILIISIWVLSCVGGVGSNLFLIFKLSYGNDYFMIISAALIISIGAIISAIYCCIIRFLLTRQVTVAAKPGDEKVLQKIKGLFRGPQKAERTVLLSCIIVTVTFIICMFPFAIEYMRFRNAETLTFASKMLIVLNSLLNPFVYFFNNFLRRNCTKPQ